MPGRLYTTQLQAGLGLIHETQMLLAMWQPGMTGRELYEAALRSGDFPNVSARRLRNIVIECFAPRYLGDEAKVAEYLKQLRLAMPSAEIAQLFFLYTCRANPILGDFVREVYWERYTSGANLVSKDDAKSFIQRGIDDGRTSKRWSDSTITRVSSYLMGCCADYGLLGKRTLKGREIIPYRLSTTVAAYLAHDLHFSGLGDNAVIRHEDWGLYGVDIDDVRDEFRRISLKGYFILQTAGDVTHIGWRYKTMEAFVDVLAQG